MMVYTCMCEPCLELLFKARDVSIRNGGTQSVGGDTQVTCWYLSFATCNQFLQCIMNKNVLGLQIMIFKLVGRASVSLYSIDNTVRLVMHASLESVYSICRDGADMPIGPKVMAQNSQTKTL